MHTGDYAPPQQEAATQVPPGKQYIAKLENSGS